MVFGLINELRTMSNKLANILIFVGVALGLLSGATGNPLLYQIANVISALFMNLLKFISLPIIFLAITSTVTGMRNWDELQNIGKRILKYTLLTTIIAASLALLLFLLLNPVQDGIVSATTTAPVANNSHYLDFLLKIIPPNFAEAFHENNVIGIAFIAFLFSIATLQLPEENKKVLQSLFSSLFAALLKITSYAIALMPIGIWAFMTLMMHDLHEQAGKFHSILLYVVIVLSANVLQAVVILPLLLKWRGLSPIKTFKGSSKALLMAFVTKSSNATLPLSITTAQNNLKVSTKVANTSLPLCSVINMNGCAAFILTTVLFVAMSNGIQFSSFDLILWVFLATLAAIGNAGVPMGCYFLSSAFLVAMDVPLYIMGLILPIYTIMDMIETALNVWSDISITAIVDKELKETSPVLNDEIAPAPSLES
jgi:Na+/H+-dicarboxylate symporter